jgi:hypothetical protein
MTPEYKSYIGPVLLDLLELAPQIELQLLSEDGRADTMLFQRNHCLMFKYSAKRITPWRYTFPKYELAELLEQRKQYPHVFIVLVCGRDGVVLLSIDEFMELIDARGSDQCWLRVDRRPRHMYRVSGNAREADRKFASGVDRLAETITSEKSELSRSASVR